MRDALQEAQLKLLCIGLANWYGGKHSDWRYCGHPCTDLDCGAVDCPQYWKGFLTTFDEPDIDTMVLRYLNYSEAEIEKLLTQKKELDYGESRRGATLPYA